LRRQKRVDPAVCRSNCDTDYDYGIIEDKDECYAACAPGMSIGGGEEEEACQNYEFDAFQLCCPEGLDVDYFWPMVRPDARGQRPIAPGELCPTGCEVAKQVDLFACSFFERINLLQMMLDELDTFVAADLDKIIDFKKQFVRRYREVEEKGVRSAAKMAQISEKMQLSIRYVQENEAMITRLQGKATSLTAQAEGVQGKIDALHAFCKIGKQCAKQCFFGPELFGGIKKDCAAYYHDAYWTSNDAREKEYHNLPQSGIYIIQPHASLTPKYAYCDQKTDGGGWTLLQHNGISRSELWEKYTNTSMKYQTDWAQNWANYKHGFGHVMCNGEADFWIGLDYMHALTHPKMNGRKMQTGRIDINDWDGEEYWGYYNKFIVMPEARNYQLIANRFTGVGSYSIGDAFAGMAFGGNEKQKRYTKHDGMAFSTKGEWSTKNGQKVFIHDNDNLCKPTGFTRYGGMSLPKWSADDVAAQCDKVIEFDYDNYKSHMALWGSCAQQDSSGWWYNRCSAGNLNGRVYQHGYYELKTIRIQHSQGSNEMMRNNHDDGLIWTTLHNKGKDYSFMMGEIRIRPSDFRPRQYDVQKSQRTMRNGGNPDPQKMN